MSEQKAAPPAPAAVAAAAAGLLAGGLTLAVADVAAVLTTPAASPVLAVGGTFVDLTPSWLKDVAVRSFGEHDKQVLLGGMAVTIGLLCCGIGLIARRRRRLAVLAVALLGLVAAVAALARPGAGLLAVVPAVIGTACGAAVLVAFFARARHDVTTGTDAAGTARRRTVLRLGVGAGLVLAAAGASRAVRGAVARSTSPGSVTLPPAADPAPALPRLATFDGALAEQNPDGGWTPFATPAQDFYRVDTALAVPRVAAGDWRLRVRGLVAEPFELDLDEVLAQPLIERWITLTCVSNEVGGRLAGNALWRGLPLADLLRRARPHRDADMVLSRSVDGWTASTPLDALTDGRDAMLAVGMNGAPLPVEHGFPARLVVPGLYGYVSATKWVVELEVTRFDRATSYWTDRGWSATAPIKTFSRIDVPRPFARVRPGPVQVGGVAWAQHRGLARVEVSVDDGRWQPARLATGAGQGARQDTWAQWIWSWDATPGRHTLRVRATDRTGAVQPAQRRPPKPDGATGWHSVAVQVA